MGIKYKFILDDYTHEYPTFNCSSFDDLTQLDNYHDIVWIDCANNKLLELPTLPNNLVYLYCNSNKGLNDQVQVSNKG